MTVGSGGEHKKIISMWFENWVDDLVSLGFVFEDDNDKVTIPNEQLQFIIDFSKMCLSVEVSEGRRGGHPEIVLHDLRFPMPGKSTNKVSLAATLIC